MESIALSRLWNTPLPRNLGETKGAARLEKNAMYGHQVGRANRRTIENRPRYRSPVLRNEGNESFEMGVRRSYAFGQLVLALTVNIDTQTSKLPAATSSPRRAESKAQLESLVHPTHSSIVPDLGWGWPTGSSIATMRSGWALITGGVRLRAFASTSCVNTPTYEPRSTDSGSVIGGWRVARVGRRCVREFDLRSGVTKQAVGWSSEAPTCM